MQDANRWLEIHYEKDEFQVLECIHCGELFPEEDKIQQFKLHLSTKHEVTELDQYPEYVDILKNYEIITGTTTAKCNHCKRIIDFSFGVQSLKVHLMTTHMNNLSIFLSITSKKSQQLIWNKFDIRDNLQVRCKSCKEIITVAMSHPTRNVREHLERCPSISAPIASSSTRDDDIHGIDNQQVQTEAPLTMIEPPKKKRKKTNKSDDRSRDIPGSDNASSSSVISMDVSADLESGFTNADRTKKTRADQIKRWHVQNTREMNEVYEVLKRKTSKNPKNLKKLEILQNTIKYINSLEKCLQENRSSE